MSRPFLLFVLLICGTAHGQSRTLSLGLSTGITSTYSWSQGIQKDPRYSAEYNVKWSPLNICYGIDFEGFGISINPGLLSIGQRHYVVNTVGGQKGIRKANLSYFQIPVFIRIHLIDMSFFKVSFAAGFSPSFLIKGSEKISINAGSKLWFPDQVYPLLPPEYQVEYDGVIVPAVNQELLSPKDFNTIQFFALTGLRADWDISENLRVSVDFQLHYGLFDPRSSAYINDANSYKKLYDLPGKQRDMFAYLGIGIARFIELETKKKTKSSPVKVFNKKNSRIRSAPPKT